MNEQFDNLPDGQQAATVSADTVKAAGTKTRPKNKRSAAKKPTNKSSLPKSEENNRFLVRLPSQLHQQIKQISKRNKRSMNAEIVLLLQSYLFEQGLTDDSLESSLKRELSSLDESKRKALLALLE